MKEKKKLNQNTFLLLVTILLFFVMYAIGCVLFNAQGFAKTQNFLNLFISNAGLIVIGIGMTIVMITGGIDISVGSFVAMGCMMLAWMMEKGGIGAVRLPGGAHRRRGSHRAGDRDCLWSGTGIPGCLHGYPAIYCYPGGYVLCPRHDRDHFQGHDQYYE